jgi:hypothetical protein
MSATWHVPTTAASQLYHPFRMALLNRIYQGFAALTPGHDLLPLRGSWARFLSADKAQPV